MKIGTLIHYPISSHLLEAYAYLGYSRGPLLIAEKYMDTVCPIPICNGMKKEEIQHVIDTINKF